MTTKKKIVITGLLIGITFISYLLFLFNSFLCKNGECGMSAGPIYGQKINVSLDSLNIDTFIPIPDGQFAISNTNVDINSYDTIPPVLIKLDSRKKNNLGSKS